MFIDLCGYDDDVFRHKRKSYNAFKTNLSPQYKKEDEFNFR